MIFSDKDIHLAWLRREIGIETYNQNNVQPNSYEATLGNEFNVMTSAANHEIDHVLIRGDNAGAFETWTVGDGERMVIEPGDFMLAHTKEVFTFGDGVCGILTGKSSYARLGLLVHITAGLFDSGFVGQAVLELANVGVRPIALFPGDPIAQMVYYKTTTPVTAMYGSESLNSHYQGQVGAQTQRAL